MIINIEILMYDFEFFQIGLSIYNKTVEYKIKNLRHKT